MKPITHTQTKRSGAILPQRAKVGTALAVVEQEPAEPEQARNLLEVIARASQDPAVNVDKLERLLSMFERVTAQQAKAAYTQAMVAMKPELPVIDRRGRIIITEKGNKNNIIQTTPYALWEDIDEAITPVLAKHGFALTFKSGVAQDGKITVTGILAHQAGHSEETTITLPHDSSGSKNAVQAVGSSTSYGKRYTATLLLNIRTHGEDDDGMKGGEDRCISEEQAQTIRDMLERAKIPAEKFCEWAALGAVTDLKAKDFDKAVIAINTREKRMAGEKKVGT